jgi:hypothetical protein
MGWLLHKQVVSAMRTMCGRMAGVFLVGLIVQMCRIAMDSELRRGQAVNAMAGTSGPIMPVSKSSTAKQFQMLADGSVILNASVIRDIFGLITDV